MTEKMQRLLKNLDGIRNMMEGLLDEETVYTLPKAYNKIKDNLDIILVDIESGSYDEEE